MNPSLQKEREHYAKIIDQELREQFPGIRMNKDATDLILKIFHSLIYRELPKVKNKPLRYIKTPYGKITFHLKLHSLLFECYKEK